jgi:hypothetical protein
VGTDKLKWNYTDVSVSLIGEFLSKVPNYEKREMWIIYCRVHRKFDIKCPFPSQTSFALQAYPPEEKESSMRIESTAEIGRYKMRLSNAKEEHYARSDLPAFNEIGTGRKRLDNRTLETEKGCWMWVEWEEKNAVVN